jgi:hypothetical protein
LSMVFVPSAVGEGANPSTPLYGDTNSAIFYREVLNLSVTHLN